MEELKIVATITVKPEFKEDILKSLHDVVDATRKEEGNVSYDLHSHVSDENVFTILEVWKSRDAITLHNASDHFEAFKKAIDGKISNLKIETIKQVY